VSSCKPMPLPSLFEQARSPAPFIEVAFWAHARRKFFELASLPVKRKAGPSVTAAAPLATEAVKRIDELFAIEREINGAIANDRLATRTSQSASIVANLFGLISEQRQKLSRHAPVAAAMDNMLKRQAAFSVFLTDGRAYLSNNAAERSLRPAALGRKAELFAGSQAGDERGTLIYTLIETPPSSTTSSPKPGSPISSPARQHGQPHASKNSQP